MKNSYYLIWSNERKAYWKPREAGYTPIPEEAGKYTLGKAAKIVLESVSYLEPDVSRVPDETLVPVWWE